MNNNNNMNKTSNDNLSIVQIKTKKFKMIESKYNNSTDDTMYQIASCSKFITNIIVAKLYELGKIDYNTDINTYLKKWKCPVKNITLLHLLCHTSGTNDGLGYLGFENFTPKNKLPSNIETINGTNTYRGVNFIEKPGKEYMYSGAGYQVIQQVLEEITGKHMYQLFNQYIFKKLKLKNSTAKILYPGKHKYALSNINNCYRLYPETAAAGVWMSGNDLLKVVMDLSLGYKYNTSKILKKDTLMLLCDKKIGTFGVYNKKIEFSHYGINYGYKMKMICFPMEGKCNIIMTHYNPCCEKHISDADKTLDSFKTNF